MSERAALQHVKPLVSDGRSGSAAGVVVSHFRRPSDGLISSLILICHVFSGRSNTLEMCIEGPRLPCPPKIGAECVYLPPVFTAHHPVSRTSLTRLLE